MLNRPLVIKDWTDAIAPSPHEGIALLKNFEVDSYPGAVRAGKKPITMFHTAYSSTFTADAGTDVCTATATVPATATCVQLTTTGTLPAGLSLATNYFINKLSSTTFELCTTIANANAGTQINITDAGTGTHTVTTVNPGTARHIVEDPRTFTTFLQDSNGRVWYSESALYLLLNGNTITNSAGNGLAVFRVSDGSATYLFAFRNNGIDVVNVFGTAQKEAPSWTNAWQTMNSTAGSGNSHKAKLGQDNIIYFTDDRYVGSIREVAAAVFDPANGATYAYTNQALDLPVGSITYWLEELGVNLLISVANDSFVYPWDRTSDSYGLPLPIGEYGGNKMINIGNVVYVLAGNYGNIYWTQGTYVRPFKTIPYYLLMGSSTTVTASPVTWGGIAAADGKLLVGVGASSGQSGVYMITPEGKMTIDNYPSTGQANVTALFAKNRNYQIGYAGGADTLESSTRYTSLEAVAQSRLYRVADKTGKGTVSEVELQLAVGLTGSVRVGYRTDLTSAFTTIATFTTGTSATSYLQEVGLIDLENIQIQAEAGQGIDIMEVILHP